MPHSTSVEGQRAVRTIRQLTLLPLILNAALAAPLTEVEPEPLRTLITNVHVFAPDGQRTSIPSTCAAAPSPSKWRWSVTR